MGTKFERPHWTALTERGGDFPKVKRATGGAPSLDDVMDEFIQVFGEQIGLELSEGKSFENYTKIQLTQDDTDQLFENSHPHLRADDFPREDGLDLNADGPQEAIIGTARLQNNLRDFFMEHLPTLMDQKKIQMAVDDDKISDAVEKIHSTIHDYQAVGLLPQRDHALSTTDIHGMLEVAFGDAVEFYRPRRTAKPEHTR